MASGPGARRRWVAVGALLALAAAVRLGAMFHWSLSGEDATLDAALGDEMLVSGMRLWHPTAPRVRLPVVQVSVSQDGREWQAVAGGRAVPQWGWAGRTLFAASDKLVEVVLAATPARHVRVMASVDAGELRLLCVRGTRVPGR